MGIEAAIIGAAVVGAGASVAGAKKQASAARHATAAQVDAADANAALQREIYYDQKDSYAPFRDLELQQANAFGQIFGFNPVGDSTGNAFAGQAGQPNYGAYVNNSAGLSGAYGSLTPQKQDYLQSQGYDTNRDGQISPEEWGAFHYQTYGKNEGRNVPTYGATTSPVTTQPAVAGQDAQTAALDRFKSSPFGVLLEQDIYNAREDLNNAFGAQGLMYSSGNDYAQAEATSRLQSNAFNNYLSAMMGSPPTNATNAQANAAANYGVNAGNAFTNRGNAQASGAIAQGNAWAGGLNGVGNAALTGIGLWGQYGGQGSGVSI